MMHLYWIGKGGVAKDFFDKYLNPQPPSTDYIVNTYLTIISRARMGYESIVHEAEGY